MQHASHKFVTLRTAACLNVEPAAHTERFVHLEEKPMLHKVATIVLVAAILLAGTGLGAPAVAQADTAATPFQDYGDAPDSTNSAGAAMTAYPGVNAAFPTAVQASGPPGPVHNAVQTRLRYILGY